MKAVVRVARRWMMIPAALCAKYAGFAWMGGDEPALPAGRRYVHPSL
jgi:hypothetical protein